MDRSGSPSFAHGPLLAGVLVWPVAGAGGGGIGGSGLAAGDRVWPVAAGGIGFIAGDGVWPAGGGGAMGLVTGAAASI